MKSTRHIGTKILVTLAATLAFSGVQAQQNASQDCNASANPSAQMQHGKKGQHAEMRNLITPEERTAMRTKMEAAKTPEERQALRTSMRSTMQMRAKEKGITMPDHQGGRKHQHGQHAG